MILATTLMVLTMNTHTAQPAAAQASLTLSSPSFTNGQEIPADFTCDGSNRAFDIAIAGVPASAKSLAIIMHDPDAPDPAAPRPQGFTHWIAYNISPTTTSLRLDALPSGAHVGMNDDGKAGYMGPCPPKGRHRYVITAYALDQSLPNLGAPKRADLLAAIKGHVIAETDLIGTYAKTKR